MSIPIVSVTGKIRTPSGSALANASIHFALSAINGHVTDDNDTSTHYTIQGWTTITSDSGGNVSFGIVPNDVIVPASTYYDVIVNGGGSRHTETWILNSVPSSIDLKNISKSSTQASADPFRAPTVSEGNLPVASSSYAGIIYRVSGPPEKFIGCLQDISGNWNWVTLALGG